MRHYGILAGVGLVALFLSGCCQVPSRTVKWTGAVGPEVLAKASLEYYWRANVDLDPGESLRNLWRVDEVLYGLTNTNRLIAVDATSGTTRWSVKVADPVQRVFAPCHVNGVTIAPNTGIAELLEPTPPSKLKPFDAVIVNTLSHALLLDRQTGQIKRKLNFSFAANTAGASDGRLFFVGAIDGRYYALRLSEGLQQWVMATQDIITARLEYADGHLYVASQDHSFYCVLPEKAENRHVWKQTTDGPLTGDFVVDGRGCFVPSQDYRLYAFDAYTGAELWAFIAQGPLSQAVQVGPRSAFQYADNDKFYAIDVATGRKRWDSADARTILGAMGNNVLVLTAQQHLDVVDEMTGEASVSLPMNGLTLFVPNASKPAVFAASADGKIACIRAIKSGSLTNEMLKETAGAPASQPASAAANLPAAATETTTPPAEAAPAPAPAQ